MIQELEIKERLNNFLKEYDKYTLHNRFKSDIENTIFYISFVRYILLKIKGVE